MLKRSLCCFLLIIISLGIPAGAKRFTQGFKMGKMHLELPFSSDWNVPSQISDQDAVDILAQPYRYLGKGAQCYAFVSRDGQYVLKLFRFDQRHFFKNRSKRYLDQKISGFFRGCKLAYTKASEETGIFYLHLNETQGKLPILKAKGPMGQSLRLPLDLFRFALQKKAVPLALGLLAALEEGTLSKRIDAIVTLLEHRIAKGIGNTDPNLWRNFGFLEDRAIEFDFGNYISRQDLSEPGKARAELERYLRPLRSWLEINAPECLPDLNSRFERAFL